MAQITPEWIANAMEAGLRDELERRLRDFFSDAAKPVIEEMVQAALDTFVTNVKQHHYLDSERLVIETILTDKREQ